MLRRFVAAYRSFLEQVGNFFGSGDVAAAIEALNSAGARLGRAEEDHEGQIESGGRHVNLTTPLLKSWIRALDDMRDEAGEALHALSHAETLYVYRLLQAPAALVPRTLIASRFDMCITCESLLRLLADWKNVTIIVGSSAEYADSATRLSEVGLSSLIKVPLDTRRTTTTLTTLRAAAAAQEETSS